MQVINLSLMAFFLGYDVQLLRERYNQPRCHFLTSRCMTGIQEETERENVLSRVIFNNFTKCMKISKKRSHDTAT